MAAEPFWHGLATKSACFVAIYSTKQTEQPLSRAAASALRRLLAYLQAPVHILYTRTAAGEIRQASCSKRLRKLSPRACSTFFVLSSSKLFNRKSRRRGWRGADAPSAAGLFSFAETCLNPSQPRWQFLKQEGKRGLPLCTSLYRFHSCFPVRDFLPESTVPCYQRSPSQSTVLSLRSSEQNREPNFLIYNQIIYCKTLGYDSRICNLCRKGFIGDTAWTMISRSSI